MKKLVAFFSVLTLSLSLSAPLNTANAQTSEIVNESKSVDPEVLESLMNSDEPFTIINGEVNVGENIFEFSKESDTKANVNGIDAVVSPQAVGGDDRFYVTISESFGGVTGMWDWYDDYPTTKVNITMDLNYRTSGLDFFWDTVYTEKYYYDGGQGYHETNQKTWYPSKGGHYRACASGTFRSTKDSNTVTACSGTVKKEDGIIIASPPKEVEKSEEVTQ